ncbi:trans-2,3-dihydro-3-hydroxyanthranilate isomerase [Salibacterium salarium]|uniref:PhzF family phenazine biosynthesis protein n=1 Tax=Salibacterium salarium TaxID=284579 RepID=A0A3R9P785_9BACI|nr:PhzF family phenazine biosynthesis protein [Salibacterium salarium]MDQ0300526.1 trans-2,3-dihydro-3-hydroxyanthranilate isomerase [Salibacterium salarium]RSL31784.1 PhzF family phenazine biosynthesis protein [Salibacterium salarium]
MKFYIVDVFAESKYQGNQLAVLIPEGYIGQEEMQNIAKEINFSETTFIMSGLQTNGGYDVKIFTPDSEIPFAGHPTIGTAYVIQRFIEKDKNSEIKLNLKVGQVPVDFKDQNVWMTQNQPTFGTKIDVDTIAKTLQINTEDINAEYPVQTVSTGLPSIIVNLKTLDAVNRCKVAHQFYDEILEEVGNANLLVYTDETVNKKNDLHARVFMFTSGHLEDPATGSANGNLAGYLLKYNFFNSSEVNYTVEQGYPTGRQSLLNVIAQKTNDQFLIQVGGGIFVPAEGNWL